MDDSQGLAVLVAAGLGDGDEGGDGDAAGAGTSIFVACDAITCHLPSRRA